VSVITFWPGGWQIGSLRVIRQLEVSGPDELSEIDTFRNLEPKSMIAETKSNMEALWNRKMTDSLGSRPASVQKAFEMKPETPVSE